jgi:hypothetical protein
MTNHQATYHLRRCRYSSKTNANRQQDCPHPQAVHILPRMQFALVTCIRESLGYFPSSPLPIYKQPSAKHQERRADNKLPHSASARVIEVRFWKTVTRECEGFVIAHKFSPLVFPNTALA